jgi:hypothetical protein
VRRVQFRLAGRASPDPSDVNVAAPFSDGWLLLGPACRDASRRTGGAPPPCFAELWRSDGPANAEAVLVGAGGRAVLTYEGQEIRAETSWARMGSPLLDCIGQPLVLPPGLDAKGYRMLEQAGDDFRWDLVFSGSNRCALEGQLGLDLAGPGVDTKELLAGGLPWSAGGRENATRTLQAETRTRAVREWPGLPDDQRILLLSSLSNDPDPEAASVLSDLRKLDPKSAPDIDAAFARRGSGLP